MTQSDDVMSISPETVLAVVRAQPGQLGKREIAKVLGATGEGRQELKQILRDLEADGAIARVGRRAYRATDDLPPVTLIEITGHDGDGDLIARVAGEGGHDAPIRIPAREASGGAGRGRRGVPGGALGLGDRAVARLSRNADGEWQGKIIKRLGKDGRRVLGVVRTSNAGLRIGPTNKSVKSDLAVRKTDEGKLKPGDLVSVTIDQERRHGLKTANIVEVVGDAAAPYAASLIALHEHGVPEGFGDAELAEAEAAAPASMAGREDLRDTPLITIDPDDARDHDDAVWAAPDASANNKGGHVVIVAIADVAAYVTPGSALDRGAQDRGNSVYFPDRVVPMLPERLSTDLCSLVEGEDRPCLAVRMVFDADGRKINHQFARAMMRSAAKLAYEQAQAAIDGDAAAAGDTAMALLDTVLKPLWAAYAACMKAREARAPLDLDLPERRVRIAADGTIASITQRERFDAHKLIEEFMIQANVCAAETLEKKRSPLIYRVHDEPAREKLHMLADFLPEVGERWNKAEPATPGRFNRLIAKARAGEHADVVSEMVLRSQSQAIYTPDNVGHFGLALDRYAHFTSPIRRYADLIVHRALIAALKLGPDPATDGLPADDHARLQGVAERISATERRAMAAERDATDRYLAAYLADQIGATFKARISGLNRAGLFVRLEDTGADGLIPISTLGLERFRHDPAAHQLVGEETGGRYRMGMDVEVRLMEAAPVTGGLIFEVETPPEAGPKPSRRGPAPHHRRGRKGRPGKGGRRR